MTPNGMLQAQRTLEALSALSYRAGAIKPYLQQIAMAISDLLALDWSVVTLCNGDIEKVLASTIDFPTGNLDDDESSETEMYDLHGSLTGTVFRQGVPLVVDDATAAPDWGEAPEGYCAYLGVPLRIPSGEVIGTVCSFHKTPRHFTPDEVRLAELFADRAAIAIDNYRLFRQQQQVSHQLEDAVIRRTAELRATQAKLMTINDELEQRVAQRTMELQQLNAQLHAEILERQQTEQALRQSEEQLRQIAENMSQVLWMCSADHTPIYLSPAFETVWGVPCSDWYGDPKVWDRAIHPDDQERVLAAIRDVTDCGFDEDYRIIRPDGAVRIIRDRGFPIRNEAGEVYRVAGIAEDITERRQEQQHTLAAIERLAEVGELTAMIVHEVRNPLTTVMMGLESFRRLDLADASKQRLELALDEAQRLRSLLNEILLYAKPQTLEQTELDLNGVIANLLESLRTMPSALQRRVRWQPASQPVRVRGDVDKLKQVVINLVNNACEAVAPKAVVTCRVTVSTDGGHPQACLSVHNPGAIPAEIVPKLTKPFYTTKSSGTGLGLAIVKRIVDAHQGELAIASSEEEGTTVLVRLPVVLVAQSSAPDIR